MSYQIVHSPVAPCLAAAEIRKPDTQFIRYFSVFLSLPISHVPNDKKKTKLQLAFFVCYRLPSLSHHRQLQRRKFEAEKFWSSAHIVGGCFPPPPALSISLSVLSFSRFHCDVGKLENMMRQQQKKNGRKNKFFVYFAMAWSFHARHDKKFEVCAVLLLTYTGLVRRTRWTTYGVKRTKWAKWATEEKKVHIWKICCCLQWSGTLPNIYLISHRYIDTYGSTMLYVRCKFFDNNNFVFCILFFARRSPAIKRHRSCRIITGKLLQFLHSPLSVHFMNFLPRQEENDLVVWDLGCYHGWHCHWEHFEYGRWACVRILVV